VHGHAVLLIRLRNKLVAPSFCPLNFLPVSMDSAAEPAIDQARLRRFLGYRLTRTEILVHKLFLRRAVGLALKPSEYSILVLIDAQPGIYLRQLSVALDISPSNLVPVVERLVQRGLVERRVDGRDRRLQQLHLTAAGQTLLSRAEHEVEGLGQLELQPVQRLDETTMPPTISTKARA
jgi:DNA-binding MarR family transcriptional regulator